MPVTSTREICAARRLDNVRYAIRDLAVMADDLVQQGKKILYLNVGDPNIYDFQTPAHLVEAVAKAMRDNKNGYAPSQGIPEAVEAIRNEAVRKGLSSVRDVFVNGVQVLKNGEHTGATPGRVVRGPGWKKDQR